MPRELVDEASLIFDQRNVAAEWPQRYAFVAMKLNLGAVEFHRSTDSETIAFLGLDARCRDRVLLICSEGVAG